MDLHLAIPFSRSIASPNPTDRAGSSAHNSPTAATRSLIFRSLNDRGSTSPRSTSAHVHGAETGAPGLARTSYAAANVAL
jgi:hypothetical protein